MIIGLLALASASGMAAGMDFSVTKLCDSEERKAATPHWCLVSEFPEGLPVAILGPTDCSARTGRGRTVGDLEGFGPGTELESLKCKGIKGGETAAIGVSARHYRKLEVSPVTKESVIEHLKQRVLESAAYRNLDHQELGELRVHRISRGRGKSSFLVASADMGKLPFLVDDKRVRLIERDDKICSAEPEAFSLNGDDFVRLNVCVCNTGGCGTRFAKLGE